MQTSPDPTRELVLLEQIEYDPDVTQATLAAQLGVAIGTVNWHLKRLVAKGYIKVKRAQRRKLRYIITPEGIALRARLTINYVETSMRLYRRTRQRVLALLGEQGSVRHRRSRFPGFIRYTEAAPARRQPGLYPARRKLRPGATIRYP